MKFLSVAVKFLTLLLMWQSFCHAGNVNVNQAAANQNVITTINERALSDRASDYVGETHHKADDPKSLQNKPNQPGAQMESFKSGAGVSYIFHERIETHGGKLSFGGTHTYYANSPDITSTAKTPTTTAFNLIRSSFPSTTTTSNRADVISTNTKFPDIG